MKAAPITPGGDRAKPPTAAESELPAGWRITRRGPALAGFAYGSHIEIDIDPRYHTKRAQRQRNPTTFRVLLRKRYYAHQLVGDATPLGAAPTMDEALKIARKYMRAFVEDRKEVAMETRQELESDPVMADDAEEAIITEAATEAAIEVAGYSDELLINDLRGLLENGDEDATILQSVVHRDAREFEVVYIADGYEQWGRNQRLREFYKQFEWLNNQKLSTTLSVGELNVLIGAFEKTRMIRYIADEDEESIILIQPDHPVHIPPFERQVADIVSEKWERTD